MIRPPAQAGPRSTLIGAVGSPRPSVRLEAARNSEAESWLEAVLRVTRQRRPAAVAAAVEFVLEGLHLSKRLNKDASAGSAAYRGRT